MHKEGYIPRIVDAQVEEYLEAFGAVEVAGTMWSGKTWTSEEHASSEVSLVNRQARSLAEIDPAAVLAGEAPRVIDEWQEVPEIWDVVRQRVDDAGGRRGLFLLTGSSSPAYQETHHSGAGRIGRLRMWPMTLAESGDSDGSVSLRGLFEGDFAPGPVETDLSALSQLVCRGGWPAAMGVGERAARVIPRSYLDSFITTSESASPLPADELRALLRSLARNVGASVTRAVLAKDVFQTEGPTAAQLNAVTRGARYLESHYVVSSLGGWDAPIKSPSRLRTKPKYLFADPSLPAALLGASPDRLMENLQLLGQLFEEMCLRDLEVYARAHPDAGSDPLRYYRDSDGLEVDAIIELDDGRWGAIEIKLGENKVEQAEKNLSRLARKIAANPAARNPEPSFMAVLVGKTNFKYRTEAGTYVLPITCLAP